MDDEFSAHRALLMGVAYRVLGRVIDAEDVVQEAWLRWSKADRAEVSDPAAFLVRVTTRLSIDRLRRIKARPESPVGPWLPEPVLTDADVSDGLIHAESVSLAMLVVMETLSPLERTVFVLRDCFSQPYGEIAESLGRSQAAVRQVARRARQHVRERRPRFDIDPGTRREVTERFFLSCVTGDLEPLVALLAPGVELIGDGGGRAKAPLRVIVGPDKVARWLLGVMGKGFGAFLRSLGLEAGTPMDLREVQANGGPGAVLTVAGSPVVFLQVDVADGLVQRVYMVTDPMKMSGLMSHGDRVLRQ